MPRLIPTALPSRAAFSRSAPAPLCNRAASLRRNGDIDPTTSKTHTHSETLQAPIFNANDCVNANGCVNPELDQLGDDDVYRQTRMTSCRRDGKSSRAHNHNKNRRHRSSQSRGYRQDKGQIYSNTRNDSHSGNHNNSQCMPGQHGSVPPSHVSSTPATAPGRRIGADHNPGGTPNERQPGNFRSDN